MIDSRRLARGLALQALYEIDSTQHRQEDVISVRDPMAIRDYDARLLGYFTLRARYEYIARPVQSVPLTDEPQPLNEQLSEDQLETLSMLSDGAIEAYAESPVILERSLMAVDFEETIDGVRLTEEMLTQQEQRFALRLVRGVLKNKSQLDAIIYRYAPEWPIDQMAVVERNILRIAIYEFGISTETPIKVAINEAIELTKIFGSDSAPRFVNGVLGALADRLEEINRELDDLDDE